MASFADFYTPYTGTPLAFGLGENSLNRNRALEDHGVNRFKMSRDYGRGASDLVDRFSDRGAARSGALRKSAGRMQEDYNFNVGDSERLLSRSLSDFDRQRRMMTFGAMGG